MNNINMAFLLTFVAGFSTLIGTIPIFFKIRDEDYVICAALALASGVMFSVSILDLIPEAFHMLNNCNSIIMIILIFIFILIGIFCSYFIDYIFSNKYNYNLYKIGVISMLAIVLHNIPEGIITFISTSKDIKLGISLAIAIALHNIPEGISISIPIYYSTKSRLRAFGYTLISAISEPLGAIITYLFLYKYINNFILGLLFSIIAGIMIQISLCELIPTSKEYKLYSVTNIFFIIGVILMIINMLF